MHRHAQRLGLIYRSAAVLFLLTVGLTAAVRVSLGGATAQSVTMTYDDTLHCYKVEFDLTTASHKEAGRQYAQRIVENIPQFAKFTDAALKETLEEAKMTFEQALANAKALSRNIPQDYMDEIDGMGMVFSDPSDEVGNGRLSPNKLFVSIIFEDVTESAACSAAAVFGPASATGSTIVGRNNDWPADEEMDKWNALFIFHNGDKSVAGNGLIGELFPTNVFNRHHVLGCSLASYPSSKATSGMEGKRSPTVDLRHAIESSRTLAEAETFLTGCDYATGSLLLLADKDKAHVLEYDASRPKGQRGRIRTPASGLRGGETWGLPDAIATVNSFVLPGGFDNHTNDPHNKLRFGNFRNLIKESLARGPLGVDQMQGVMGYTAWDGNSVTSGAIFRLGIGSGAQKDSSTFQSIVLKLDTLEMWMAYSAFGKRWPYHPVYYKVLERDPFK